MSMVLRRTGKWIEAQNALNNLTVNLFPSFTAYVDSAGQMVVDRILSHIDAQDLNWTPLAPRTIELKGGSETILVETGLLRNSIQAINIKSQKSFYSIFVGALNSVTNDEGVGLGEIMTWIEYGTDKMPARPVIRPSWEEVRRTITAEAVNVLRDLVKG